MIDLLSNDRIFEIADKCIGKFFPFFGLKKKAVEVYWDEIEKSSLSPEAKAFAIYNTKNKFKEFENQMKIAEIAQNNANEGTDFSDSSKVNEDWFSRFMDSARFVSDVDVQLIWGGILAKEFESPNSTPPNMIRVLSEITPQMAKAFKILCSMEVTLLFGSNESEKIIFVPFYGNNAYFLELDISFAMICELETLGLIKYSADGYVTNTGENKKIGIKIDDENIINVSVNKETHVGNVMLTSAGEALCRVTDRELPGQYNLVLKKYLEEHERLYNYKILK